MRLLEPDSATLIDIEQICEARSFSPSDRDRLIDYVTGAVRPNRDKPIWEACQLLSRLADAYQTQASGPDASAKACITTILNPSPSLPDTTSISEGELVPSYSHSKVLLAFLEFLFIHGDFENFATMQDSINSICTKTGSSNREAQVKETVSAISRYMHRYRIDNFPAAQHEKVFRAILGYLGDLDDSASVNLRFSDDDMLYYWESALASGERPLFRTVVSHFQIVATVSSDLRDQAALNTIEALDASDWLLNSITEQAGVIERGDGPTERYRALLGFLDSGQPEGVKAFTKVERRQLRELVDWGVFLPEFPLTILRILSFGAVQSGISNFLRRGSGGQSVENRVTCEEASEYHKLLSLYDGVKAHLDRLVAIAAFAVFEQGTGPSGDQPARPAELEAILEQGRRELHRIKREGFDLSPSELKTRLEPAVPALVGLREAVVTFLDAARKLTDSEPLEGRFDADRLRFSGAFTQAYNSNDTEAQNVTADT